MQNVSQPTMAIQAVIYDDTVKVSTNPNLNSKKNMEMKTACEKGKQKDKLGKTCLFTYQFN